MKILSTTTELRAYLQTQPGRRVFVPTMGNLHAGHLYLVDRAKQYAARVIVSIFVNPAQFGENEDYAAYPRTLEEDCARLEQHGAAAVFTPGVETMYPTGTVDTTQVYVPQLSDVLCGASRPGHFAGVATVVNRLFNLVQPHTALFGEKDYQQLLVIRRMAADLFIPVEIVGVPTQREADGLALSSRNRYLSAEERRRAPRLYQILQETRAALDAGERNFALLERRAEDALRKAGFTPDYVAVRCPGTLAPCDAEAREWRVLAAARLGQARLIDNI